MLIIHIATCYGRHKEVPVKRSASIFEAPLRLLETATFFNTDIIRLVP